ncbi:MAG: class II aldolase/adducin family protein [Bacillota bacterium]|nr:class II aldolase/adducin family protein [Bacillota bacterium]
MPRDEGRLRKEVVECGRRLVARGLVTGTAGNLSARLDAVRFLVTPSGMDYERFGPGDLCAVNGETGEVTGPRRPSIETGLHAAVYRLRPDVGAVVHTHSLFATALAAARRELPCILDAMAVQFGGPVPVARYAIPGSKDLADSAARTLGDGGAVLLANHGVVAVGGDLEEAMSRAELVERAAQTFLLAASVGKAVPLDNDSIRWIQTFFRTSYGQHPGQGKEGE